MCTIDARPQLRKLSARFFCGLIVASLVAVVGCGGGSSGPGKDSVSGKVTLNGAAVSGTVTFIGPDNRPVESPIRPDGGYTIEKPSVGANRITVRGMLQPKLPKDAPPTGTTAGGSGASPPEKYANPNTSNLSFEVKGGKQTYDIPLTP